MESTSLIFHVIPYLLCIGFVSLITFLETWMKFCVPGINLELGLGVDRIMFSYVNKVEWIFPLIIISPLFIFNLLGVNNTQILFFLLLSFLLLQSVWFLKELDKRTNIILDHRPVSPSKLRFLHIILERIKVFSLGTFALWTFKKLYHKS